jgi:hypothetical protein
MSNKWQTHPAFSVWFLVGDDLVDVRQVQWTVNIDKGKCDDERQDVSDILWTNRKQ